MGATRIANTDSSRSKKPTTTQTDRKYTNTCVLCCVYICVRDLNELNFDDDESDRMMDDC